GPSVNTFGTDQEVAMQNDAALVQEQQNKFIDLIRQNNGVAIDGFLKDSSMLFDLSSGSCTLHQLLERCEPPLMHMALQEGKYDALHALIYNMPAAALNTTDIEGKTLLMH